MAERSRHTYTLTTALQDWGNFSSPNSDSETLHDSLIRGHIDRTELDLISFSTPKQVVERTAVHVLATPKRHIFSAMLQGESTWAATGSDATTTTALDRNNIGYWTSEIPYVWNFPEPFTLLTLRVPYSSINIPAASLAPLCGGAFSTTSGLAQHLVPFAQNILEDPLLLDSPTGSRLLSDLVSLFGTLLAGELNTASHTDLTQPAFNRVTEYLDAHLCEAISLSQIAADTDMSARYIQSLFQKRGSTLSDWVRSQRLDLSRRLLADHTRSHLGIGAVAHECGFADHGHFARSFRAAFRETPSEWRARAAKLQ